jgi:hypothetical protein
MPSVENVEKSKPIIKKYKPKTVEEKIETIGVDLGKKEDTPVVSQTWSD